MKKRLVVEWRKCWAIFRAPSGFVELSVARAAAAEAAIVFSCNPNYDALRGTYGSPWWNAEKTQSEHRANVKKWEEGMLGKWTENSRRRNEGKETGGSWAPEPNAGWLNLSVRQVNPFTARSVNRYATSDPTPTVFPSSAPQLSLHHSLSVCGLTVSHGLTSQIPMGP